MRVLICPDKFKGTLDAKAAASAMGAGWRSVRPKDRVELIPISDGGDGFGALLSERLGARPRRVGTVDAAHRRCTSTWWWHDPTQTALVESARTVGLAMLPPGRHHPFELDTFGLGAVLRAVSRAGARRCVVGIGGSATNDAGFGMARALGWTFLDRTGGEICSWPDLRQLAEIRPPEHFLFPDDLTVAVDVKNRLLGKLGCSRIYGPQKGLRPEDFAPAEAALKRLATVARRQLGEDFAKVPGSGAAGGLGFGLLAFCGAKVAQGIELFDGYAGLRGRVRRADLVITGEGRIDSSSLMGKGAGYVLELCRESKVPCACVAGEVQPSAVRAFARALALIELTSLEEAKAEPARWLRRAGELLANELGKAR